MPKAAKVGGGPVPVVCACTSLLPGSLPAPAVNLLTHRVEGVVENGNTDHFDEVLLVWAESANLFLILSSHDTEPTHSGFKTAELEGLKALALDAGVRFKAAVRSGGQKHLLGEMSEGESRGSGDEHFDTCNCTEIVACLPPPTVQHATCQSWTCLVNTCSSFSPVKRRPHVSVALCGISHVARLLTSPREGQISGQPG